MAGRFVRGAALGAALAALVAAGGGAQAATLVHCAEGSPESLNPMLSTQTNAYDLGEAIYDRLVDLERGTIDFVPGLAERWEIGDGGLTVTFHLRRGVKWHGTRDYKPTRDFNADDVIFSFSRQWDPKHPYYRFGAPIYASFHNLGLPDLIQAIERVDDHTVRFRLKEPDAAFISAVSYASNIIQSAEYADAMLKKGTPEKVDWEPVGTGAFQLLRYEKDTMVRLRAFDGYWRGRAKLDQLVFVIAPDAAVRLAKLQAGECHTMAYPNPADLPRIKADPTLAAPSMANLNVGYLTLNVMKPGLQDKRVRQAISMAIDVKAILGAVYQGNAVQAATPVTPGHWAHNPDVAPWPHDPERARALLKEAGWDPGRVLSLYAMPVQRPYNPDARRMAEMMQADLAKVGVKTEIVSYEWGEYLKRLRMGDHDLGLIGWSWAGEPNDVLYQLLSCDGAKPGGSNNSRWCHPPYEELVVKARRTFDRDERARLYREAQAILREEAPWLPIAHSIVTVPMSRRVVDFRQMPNNRMLFYGVDLK